MRRIRMQRVTVPNELLEKKKKISRYLTSEKVDVLNIQMRAGEIIPTHNDPNTVVIVVRQGEVTFTVEGTKHRLSDKDVLCFEPLENHSLEAHTDVEIVVLKIH